MKKLMTAIIGGVFLSGCALPVPLQIASWALDGFSLLATQKSITDHGISIVAQQDCALWRGVTEGSVCREDDPMALIVDRGDVVDGSTREESTSSLVSSLTTTQDSLHKSDASSWKAGPDHADDVVSAPSKPEAVQVDSTETAELVKVQVDQAPQWQFVSGETETAPSNTDNLISYNANPGDYYVIGSFGVWDNAKRFAAKHISIDAQILAANVADYRVFRIVVGPYNISNQNNIFDDIKKAGVEDTWAVRVPADEITLAWRSSDISTELASIETD